MRRQFYWRKGTIVLDLIGSAFAVKIAPQVINISGARQHNLVLPLLEKLF
jgi:hypothetical protein